MSAVSVDFTPEAKEAFTKFTKSRTVHHTVILKIDFEKTVFALDAEFPQGISLDDVAMKIPKNEPRFILHIPERVHEDGRTSNPLLLICYCPANLSPTRNVVYSYARTRLLEEFVIPFVWTIERPLDLGDEELAEKFATNSW